MVGFCSIVVRTPVNPRGAIRKPAPLVSSPSVVDDRRDTASASTACTRDRNATGMVTSLRALGGGTALRIACSEYICPVSISSTGAYPSAAWLACRVPRLPRQITSVRAGLLPRSQLTTRTIGTKTVRCTRYPAPERHRSAMCTVRAAAGPGWLCRISCPRTITMPGMSKRQARKSEWAHPICTGNPFASRRPGHRLAPYAALT
jgi:hypothetical protein